MLTIARPHRLPGRVMAAEEDNAATGAEAGAAGRKFTVVADLEGNELREIGDEAEWILSSSKPGFGAANLRDNDVCCHLQRSAPREASITRPLARTADEHVLAV